MIVGEALRQALNLDAPLAQAVLRQAQHGERSRTISDTRRIISFRNRLVHGHSLTDHDIVWGVLERGVPVLRREVAALRGEPGPPR